MNSYDAAELLKFRLAMSGAVPGTAMYSKLLTQRKYFADTLAAEKNNKNLLPGVSNDTLVTAAASIGGTAFLLKASETSFVPPLLTKFLPILKLK